MAIISTNMLTIPNADKDLEQVEFSYTTCDNANWYSNFRKQFGQTHRYREDLTTANSRGIEGMGETGEGIRSTDW